jgi:membrane protein DedA with SNARE-associated domain
MQTALELIRPLLDVLYAHPYLFIFFGMLVAGEVVLLPAIYLAATGRLDIAWVIALSVIATVLSDFIWYYAGRRFPASALGRIPGRGTSRVVSGLEKLFRRKGVQVLFLSKFVYGTRITAQILSGVHDMPLRRYLVANTLGILAVTAALVVIAYSVVGTTHRMADVIHNMEVAFFVFVVVAVSGFLVVGQVLKRQWSQQ